MRLTRCDSIKLRLSRLGLDQQDLASACGYTRSYVSKVLNGKRAPDALNKLEGQIKHWEVVAANERRRKTV